MNQAQRTMQASRGLQGVLILTLALVWAASAPVASAQSLGADDQRLLERLVLAEAQGEGQLGMALVARSVLNRTALVRSRAVAPGTYLARSRTLSGIVNGRMQYEPVSSGSINRRRSAAQLASARRAIALAQDTGALTRALRARGLGDAEISRLLSASGFRARGAYNDRSQNYGRQAFGNHIFNGDAFSRRQDVPALFSRYYAAGNARGIVDALEDPNGEVGELEQVDQDGEGSEADPGEGEDMAAEGAAEAGAAGGSRSAGAGAARPATGGSSRGADAAEGGAPAPAEVVQPAQPIRPTRPSLAEQVNTRGPLGLGSRGGAVEELQERLGINPTGLLGLGTRAALEAWQGEHGLPATGRVDAPTVKALDAFTQPALPADAGEGEGDDVAYEEGRSLGSILLTEVDGRRVAVVTADAFLAMSAAARRDGVELKVVGGFRSMREQTAIYAQASDLFVDRPGFSLYQSGRALALNTSGPRVTAWLNARAADFGFWRSSPRETWQWEFRR